MIIIVMGVSGSGKTTIGTRLAEALRWSFVDADDFHPAANIEKMSQGMPLTEQDRRPWLSALRSYITECLDRNRSIVLACSALTSWFRKEIMVDPSRMRIVYLKASYSLIERRLGDRKGHFMPRGLLASQFATLEEPDGALVIDAALRPQDIVRHIKQGLHLS
jgi:gluconokinase